jgi:Mce-associated membrane protein
VSEPKVVESVADEAAVVDESAQSVDRSIRWRRVFTHRVFPVVALVLTLCAAYGKYTVGARADIDEARSQAMKAATEGASAILSYTPDTVEAKLTGARDRLTGDFRGSYESLTNDVVIPGAKQRLISATATVPAAASVSTSATHAVVLVFVNQTVSIGADAPSETASAVQVVLDKVGSRWLISGFEPK